MRIKPTTIPPTIFETFPRLARNTHTLARRTPAILAKQSPRLLSPTTQLPTPPSQHRKMATQPAHDAFKAYGVETPSSALPSAPGVSLSDPQTLILCSVLDLFSGHPSKRKLTLWNDDASFHDPLTNATGRKQFEAQWYGLKTAFSEIERLGVEVVSAGNPMEMKLRTRYVVKGVGSEQTIASDVVVHTTGEGEGMRVSKVEDKWDGEIKEGPFKKAFRALNAVSVPAMVR